MTIREGEMILMITRAFFPEFAGAAVQALSLAKEIRRMGSQVSFITSSSQKQTTHEVIEGFSVTRLGCNGPKDSQREKIAYTINIFKEVMRRPEARVIHFHSISGMEALLFPLLKLLGRRVILKITLAGNDDPLTLRRRKLGRLFFWGLRFADHLIAISKRLVVMSEEAGIPKEKIAWIPNGVDTVKFSLPSTTEKEELKKRFLLSEYTHVFLSVGKVESRKGYSLLFRAWRKILEKYPQAGLMIVGPGNDESNAYYKKLKQLVDKYALRNVLFMGLRQDIPALMKAADVFVFCSQAEGFGTVLIEAAATGLPVVACDLEGITEDIITHDYLGAICYKRAPEEIARGVDLVLGLPQRAVTDRISNIKERYDIGIIAQQHYALYFGNERVFPSQKLQLAR